MKCKLYFFRLQYTFFHLVFLFFYCTQNPWLQILKNLFSSNREYVLLIPTAPSVPVSRMKQPTSAITRGWATRIRSRHVTPASSRASIIRPAYSGRGARQSRLARVTWRQSATTSGTTSPTTSPATSSVNFRNRTPKVVILMGLFSSGVNFTNILRAAFVLIFLRQKVQI